MLSGQKETLSTLQQGGMAWLRCWDMAIMEVDTEGNRGSEVW